MNDLSIIDILLGRYMLPFYALGIIFIGIALENSKRRKQAKRIIRHLIDNHFELLESELVNNPEKQNESKELFEKLNRISGFIFYEIGTVVNGSIEFKNITLKETLKKTPSTEKKINQFLEKQKSIKLRTFDKIIDMFKIKDDKILIVTYSKYHFPFLTK